MWENFYKITDKRQIEGGFEVNIRFNPEHLIYKAHFPGNPITPGVCILQICQELMMAHYRKPLRMVLAKNVKFLNVLRPSEHPEVGCRIECSERENDIAASIVLADRDTVFTKISAVYKV